MANFEIRLVRADEESLIFSFLFLAARMPEAGEPIQKALANPFLKKYWSRWGRPADLGVVAIERATGMPVSCAWVRQFSREEAGTTFVAHDVPELGTGTVDGFRGQGIGAEVLKHLIAMARTRYRGVCLSVREENPAVRLYERVGFQKIPGSVTGNRVGTQSFNMLLEF